MKEKWNQLQHDSEERRKKEAEEAKKDRKKQRMGECMPLVSISMGTEAKSFHFPGSMLTRLVRRRYRGGDFEERDKRLPLGNQFLQ